MRFGGFWKQLCACASYFFALQSPLKRKKQKLSKAGRKIGFLQNDVLCFRSCSPRILLMRCPYLPKRAARKKKSVKSGNGCCLDPQQRASRSRNAIQHGNPIAQAGDRDKPAENLQDGKYRVEERPTRKRQCRNK